MELTPDESAAVLRGKAVASDEDLSLYVRLDDGGFAVDNDDELIPLLPEDESDQLEMLETEEAIEQSIESQFWDAETRRTSCDQTPSRVDHQPDQTPVRHQHDRGTCVSFASLACLEAIISRHEDGNETDLSEQYAHWMFKREEGQDQCKEGLKTTLAAYYLSNHDVCTEDLCPYERKPVVQQHCSQAPTQAAQNAAGFGVTSHLIIPRPGLQGPSIANTDYLECILSQGYDIVLGVRVAWGRNANADGVLDVLLDQFRNPLPSRGGHAMLIVGYDRSSTSPHFIVKNSWGTNREHGGYYWLSYDYIRVYAKYGYLVTQARTPIGTLAGAK